ncbi:alanine:cation symporter family protein [Pseudomonadota bacterium]|nr:alanine:cation symporter family protein [Pseudomonadota bacterium]
MDKSPNFYAEQFASAAWGPWLIFLLIGSGIFFLIYSRFEIFKYLLHAFRILFSKEKSDDEGEVSPFQALTTSLSGTIGLGNIAGVALAISVAGPGSIFWMWVTAIIGIATKFFTCTLSVMYREKTKEGEIFGGPMYVIKNGLPKRMLPLGYFFALAGMIGCLPAFQSNQLIQITGDLAFSEIENFNILGGLVLAGITGIVVIGGLKRIAEVATFLVPLMGSIYFGAMIVALMLNLNLVLPAFKLIFVDAFNGTAIAGGTFFGVLIYGVRRGAFSNEAGMGTESLVHGVAKVSNPVKQGLVAMTGPIFDTLIICTATALMILVSGVWETSSSQGVTLTAEAFSILLGNFGGLILFICVICFGLSTIFTYSYYGASCSRFLFGKFGMKFYIYLYILSIFIYSIVPIDIAINIADGAFAMMAIPTLISALWLAPKVMQASKNYFKLIDNN